MIDPDRPLDPEPRLLTKVLTGGRPILRSRAVVCPRCNWRFEQGRPTRCAEDRDQCPYRAN